MSGAANPLLEEELRRAFGRREQHLLFLHYVLILSVVLFFAWPKRYYYDYLQTNTLPFPYDVLGMAVFVVAAYLGFAALPRDAYERDSHAPAEWLRYTPLSPRQLLGGKCLLHFLSVSWLLLLSLPLLTLNHLALGFAWKQLGATLGLLLVSLTSYRLLGLLLVVLLERREDWLGRAGMATYLLLAFGTALLAPRLNVISALISLSRPEAASPALQVGALQLTAPVLAALVHLGAGSAAVGALALLFRRVKRKAAAHG